MPGTFGKRDGCGDGSEKDSTVNAAWGSNCEKRSVAGDQRFVICVEK